MLEYAPAGVAPMIEAIRQSVVASAVAGALVDANDCTEAVRDVASDVEAPVVHDVGFHNVMTLPESDVAAPNSSVPATIVPPVVSSTSFDTSMRSLWS